MREMKCMLSIVQQQAQSISMDGLGLGVVRVLTSSGVLGHLGLQESVLGQVGVTEVELNLRRGYRDFQVHAVASCIACMGT